ncbi:hypothetical protein PHISP_08248 [Aspergillus sp. HF37]|nr:hypothetical protein PHISP_08248 [Aspergillus sp. HF37]
MSPGGYHALENTRKAPRAAAKKKTSPQPSQPTTKPSSGRVTRSQEKKPNAVEHEPTAESETSDPVENTEAKSTRAPRQKKGISKKSSRRVDKAKASDSQPSHQQNLESVVIDQNATTESEEPEAGQAPRKTKAKSTTTSKRPIKTPVSRITRSQSHQPDGIENNDTTKGKEPEGGRRPRRTRAASRATAQHFDETPVLQPDQVEQTTTSEDEPPVTTDSDEPNAESEAAGAVQNGKSETSVSQAGGKENLSPNLTRKRPHSGDSEPATPKRRQIGSYGSFSERPLRRVPFLNRRPFRPVPLAARQHRRETERSGRMHSTLFQLPDFVSQAISDDQETEIGPELMDQSEPMEQSEPTQQSEPMEQSESTQQSERPDEPHTQAAFGPVTPRRSWSIRGLLHSMPRPFARFFPRMGGPLAPRPDFLDAPEENESPAPEASETPAAPSPAGALEASGVNAGPKASGALESTSEEAPKTPASFGLPESGNPDQATSSDTDSPLSEADLAYRKRLEEYERNLKREWIGDREYTYSLVPRPWDTRRFLEPSKRTSKTATPKSPSKETPKTPPKASPKPATDASPKSTSKVAENVTETTAEATPQPQKKEKKRKRAPSPDVIPNPPGCSYGMDVDYFYYDVNDFNEDEEMDSPSPEVHKDTSATPKSAIRNAEQTIAPPSKKVRFDASPQDSPSKVRSRARASDPYTGGHFVGVGEESPTSAQTDQHVPPGTAPSPGTPSATASRAMTAQPAHTPATGSAAVPGTTPTSGPMHATGPTAAPGLTGASGATVAPAPTAAPASPAGPSPITAPTPATPRLTDTQTGQSAAPSPVAPPDQAAPAPASDQAPTGRSTTPPPSDICPEEPTTATKPEDEVVAKARSQVEKFKPKTPSTLRTACHNSSPLTMSPELFSHLRRGLDFGEDQAGRDAQWLFELCPSGNIEELKWPPKQKVTDSLDVDPKPRQLLVKSWNNLEMDDNHSLFSEMVEEF